MATLNDIRTRKLADGRVEAIAISDELDKDGDPIVLRGYGGTPDEATKDVEAQAARLSALQNPT